MWCNVWHLLGELDDRAGHDAIVPPHRPAIAVDSSQVPVGDPFMRLNSRAVGNWNELQMDEGGHGRRTRWFVATAIALVAVGAFVQPALIAFALVPAMLGGLEYAMYRRSRPVSKIPDYRPQPTNGSQHSTDAG